MFWHVDYPVAGVGRGQMPRALSLLYRLSLHRLRGSRVILLNIGAWLPDCLEILYVDYSYLASYQVPIENLSHVVLHILPGSEKNLTFVRKANSREIHSCSLNYMKMFMW